MLTITNEDNMVMMARYPDKHFDLAIVDPPYGIGLDMVTKVDGNKRAGRKNGSVVKHKEKKWNDHIPSEAYFKELHRVSKHQIIWGCNYYAKHIPALGRIVHDKMMGTENTAFNWSHADLASCSLFKRIVMYRYQWAGNKQGGTINWFNTGSDARIHPTQKPISLYKYCLTYAKPGWKILDTHLGSGSIAIACNDYGFDLTACELDQEYFAAALQRIKQHTDQLKIF